ncbi:MAG TPA: hypothetical protein VHM31_00570, partial [Polyangia bacterium]|nr:hypothetical protein [Polyangia bacterium]
DTGAVAAADSAHHAAGGGAHRRRAHDSAGDSDATAGAEDVGKPAEAAADCSITVNSVPWSEVWIDGKNTTQHTPLVDYKVPCGKHKLNFKRTDMQIDHTENITVRAGGKFKQRYTLATDE